MGFLGKYSKLHFVMKTTKRIVAIGNDAEKVACKISDNLDVIKVRHPSYGGQADFLRQTHQIYTINKIQRVKHT